MLDPWLFIAMAAAGGVGAALALAFAWPGREPARSSVSIGTTLGVGLGFLVGCFVMGIRPHWPPREDVDRFLLVLLPALIVVEAAAAVPKVPRYARWLLRGGLALSTSPILLHNTIYLADLGGPGSREWSGTHAMWILAGLAAALLAAWAALRPLASRAAAPSLPIALAVVCAASGGMVMLSGYATGGQLGLPLAGALLGVGLVSLLLRGRVDVAPALSVGLVGLFGLLVIGRFFGTLTTLHAIVLFAAPPLAWLPETISSPRLRPWMRAAMRLALVAIPVVFVLTQAWQKFSAEARPPAWVVTPPRQTTAASDFSDSRCSSR